MALITGKLEVDGASLYYEDHGNSTKPALLLIPPGNGTCLYYKTFIPHLVSTFRIITFDRRGFHRSPLSISPSPSPSTKDTNILHANATDCSALITHLSPNTPVSVFASSGNATIGLNLLHHHPNLVTKLILHEPILPTLHPREEATAAQTLIHDTRSIYSTSGSAAANRKIMPHVSSTLDLAELKNCPVLEDIAALGSDSPRMYFAEELPALASFEVNVVSIMESREKVILARGAYPGVRLAQYPVIRLGDLLAKEPVVFPGGHNGYVTHPGDFAERVVAVLSRGLEYRL